MAAIFSPQRASGNGIFGPITGAGSSTTRRPGAATLRTGWTGMPDNTVIQNNINEASASDATYITSPVINGSQGPARFEIVDGDTAAPSPLPPGSWEIPFRAEQFNGSAQFRARLLDNTMAVLGTGAWQALTGAYAVYTSTITIAGTATHIELEVQ